MLNNAMIAQLRKRRVPLIGDGDGWWSFTHIDDTAAARHSEHLQHRRRHARANA
jgi:nucleoside-diphosphate-sugar epimerase